MNVYAQQFQNANAAAYAPASERAAFIRRTYMHLAIAILAFVGVEYGLLQSGIGKAMLGVIMGNQFGWLLFLGGFVLVGWLARSLAASPASPTLQYGGLFLYVLAEGIIFLPLLTLAALYSPGVILNAAVLTGLLFLALTTIVFTTQKDFSFLRGILTIVGFMAFGAIILFAFIPASTGLSIAFSLVMVAFAGGAILYDTSNVLHHYPTDRHVGASLELFASVALMFYYILLLLMSLNRR